ncbi:MAG TPA: YdcF family protein [Planctomycetaceae bacterium]|nr:YdcF family protein [Planctomycetaceae bacterium]
MDARPSRIAGNRSADANVSLHTAVFATTDAPPQVVPGGSDDYGILPGAAASPTGAAQVRWRPRPSSQEPAVSVEERTERNSVREAVAGRSGTPSYDSAAETPSAGPAAAPAWVAFSRGVAAFLGAFTLLNVLGEMRHAGFDANLWWIDLRPLPAAAVRAWLALAGMLFMAYAVRPTMSSWRGVTVAIVALLLAASVWNTLSYYGLLRRGELHSGPAVPFSLHVSVCLVVILAGLRSTPGRSQRLRRDVLVGAAAFAACLVAFPLAQMQCYGRTDYRRPADAVVVFGCAVHADGTPSAALADRVETACKLYHDGLARRLILSGGPGPGRVAETDAMRQLALDGGVPAEAIEVDAAGVNTAATVENTARLFGERPSGAVLAVSHFYHLPRIKLCYRRAGLEVYTVPAAQQRPLERQGWCLTHELAALWWYYVRPLGAW